MSPTSKLLGDPQHTLYLVDISSFIFRAFYAIRVLHNKKGEPTNAIYGVATMLAKLVEDAKPHYLAVVYDSPEPSFREEIYTDYKANRTEPPDDLAPQFDRVEELIRCLGVHSYRQSGVEADDLIATLARGWCKKSPEHHVVIVTGDKDLMQLVDERVAVWDTMKNMIFQAPEVEEKFGVKPQQIRDYLALIGDTSDNIPGVPSIGPKTAASLLNEFGDLSGVLKAAQEGKIKGKKGEVLVENHEKARLSAVLATLKMDIPLKMDFQELQYDFHVSPECVKFLQEMDFHTLVTKWEKYQTSEGVLDGKTETVEVTGLDDLVGAAKRFRTIDTPEALKEVLSGIEKSGEFGFDLETTSLDPRGAKIVGVAICYDREFACYIPVGHKNPEGPQLKVEEVLEALKPYLLDPGFTKIGQNLKYDYSVLLEYGILPQGAHADTLIAAYLLEQQGRLKLEALAATYLNYRAMTYEEVCAEAGGTSKGKNALCFDEISIALATRYSAEDAWVAVRLWDVLAPKLKELDLMRIFTEVDVPLINILAKMEHRGVHIDEKWLARLSGEFQKELQEIEGRIQAFTSEPINLNSPKQLAKLLFEELKLPVQSKTKTGYSTDAKVLDALSPLHEVPRLLLEYREISKLKGTYVDPLPLLRSAKTGKIHASFNQTVAATGRLSSSDPNLQNIPIRSERGIKIRRAFIPSPGNLLISADYSQIELRLLAHMSDDKELVRSFQSGEDVHRRTASEIFEISPENVDDRQRGVAKAINFGLMYGKSAFGLAQELKISRSEAKDTIDRYFQRYKGVKQLLDSLIETAREKGYAETLMGRKRHLPELKASNFALRGNAERMAMNTPIQGTAADLMKVAMINLDRELEKSGTKAKLIIQVHDEVVLDCPKEETENIRQLVCRVLEGAMQLKVPLKVNSAVGENWMEL